MAARTRSERDGRGVWATIALVALGLVVARVAQSVRRTDEVARSRAESEEHGPDGAIAAAAPATSADRGRIELRPEPADGARDGAGGVGASEGAERSDVAAPLANGLALRVVRGLGDEPVPGALVEFVELLSDEDPDAFPALVAGARASFGTVPGPPTRYRADAHGRLRVPAPLVGARATCRDGELFGYTTLFGHRRGAELVLRLLPDPALTVRVVDVDGAPAPGVSVGVFWEEPGAYGYTGAVLTDDDGVALVRGMRARLETCGPDARTSVSALGVFAAPELVSFDPAKLPSELELSLPPRTAIDVHVVGPDGAPWTEETLVSLAPRGGSAFDDERTTLFARTTNGLARFRDVGVGVRVVARARGRHFEQAKDVRGRAAREPGGLEKIVVAVEREPTWRGRLVLPDGAPCAERRLLVRYPNELFAAMDGARTDADGGFAVAVPGGHHSSAHTEVSIQTLEGPLLVAEAAVDGADAIEGRHLGTLELRAVVPVVAGRVVDSRGEPVADASFAVWLAGEDDLYIVERWRGSTDRDGAFSAWFPPDERFSLLLEVSHPMHADVEALRVRWNQTDAEVVMPDASGIAGTVLVDEEWLCDELYAVAVSMDGLVVSASTQVDRPGEFFLPSLEPDVYAVTVQPRASGAGRTVPDVRVAAGETTRDARLQRIDLRGALHRVSFELVDERGDALAAADVQLRDGGERGTWAPAPAKLGIVETTLAAPVFDVAVHAPGRRWTRFDGVHGGERLVLREPGLDVVATLPGIAAVAGDPERFELRSTLTWASEIGPVEVEHEWTGDELRAEMPGPGTPELDLSVRDPKTGARLASATLCFAVDDRAEPQRVAIEPTTELAAFLAAAAEDR